MTPGTKSTKVKFTFASETFLSTISGDSGTKFSRCRYMANAMVGHAGQINTRVVVEFRI